MQTLGPSYLQRWYTFVQMPDDLRRTYARSHDAASSTKTLQKRGGSSARTLMPLSNQAQYTSAGGSTGGDGGVGGSVGGVKGGGCDGGGR